MKGGAIEEYLILYVPNGEISSSFELLIVSLFRCLSVYLPIHLSYHLTFYISTTVVSALFYHGIVFYSLHTYAL